MSDPNPNKATLETCLAYLRENFESLKRGAGKVRCLTLHGTEGETGDEAIQKKVVYDGYRHSDKDARRHDGLPEKHVSPDEFGGDAGADNFMRGGSDEGQGIDELMHGKGEREDDDSQDAG